MTHELSQLESNIEEQSQQCCADRLVAINSEIAAAFPTLDNLVFLHFCNYNYQWQLQTHFPWQASHKEQCQGI